MTPQKNIRIILVNPMYQENVGYIARAMKNMGLSELVLVNPDNPPNDTARFRAMTASDIVENAKIVRTLPEALVGVHKVFGTSSRVRRLPWRLIEASEGAKTIAKLVNDGEQVAILFGREDAGLSNEDLEICNFHIYIEASDLYPVLNIAQAVQVLAYLIHREFQTALPPKQLLHKKQIIETTKAETEAVQKLLANFEDMVEKLGYDTGNRDLMHRRIKRFFTKIDWEKKEVDLFFGIVKKINKNHEKN